MGKPLGYFLTAETQGRTIWRMCIMAGTNPWVLEVEYMPESVNQSYVKARLYRTDDEPFLEMSYGWSPHEAVEKLLEVLDKHREKAAADVVRFFTTFMS